MPAKNLTPRIKNLKQQYLKYKPTINLELALAKTAVYQETQGEAMVVRRAKAMKRYCETKEINILDHELIVSNVGAWPREAVVTPEVSAHWINKELDTMSTRAYDPLQISEEHKKIFREQIFPYWEGKTVVDQWLAQIPEEIAEMGYKSGIIDCEIKTETGPGEIAPGYAEILLPQGYGGIKAHAEKRLEELDLNDSAQIEQYHFLRAVIITCEAMAIFGERHAQKAEQMAAEEKKAERKAELLKIAEVCRWVGTNPPRNFWEALQLIWFSQNALFMELSAPSYSPGRVDQYLYPYFKADEAAGILNKKEAQELLECLWIKMAEQCWYLNENSAKYYAGYTAFQNLCVGGVTPDGRDAVNEMSYMVLQASMDVKLCQPSLSVRLNKKNPDEFFYAVADLASQGTGFPAIHNDEIGIKMLMKKGVTPEEARNWCLVGCVEPNISGKLSQWSAVSAYNFGSAVEFALTNGIHVMSGKKYGLETGDPAQMKTFEEFYDAVKKQVAYLIKVSSISSNVTEIAQKELCPCPYASMLFMDCIDNGKDLMRGGARYNIGPGTLGIGIGDAANSLSAIKKLIFEEKKLTFEELAATLSDDFENHDQTLMMLLNAAPKYGNDDDYVDDFARELADLVVQEHHKYKTLNGNYFMPSLYPYLRISAGRSGFGASFGPEGECRLPTVVLLAMVRRNWVRQRF